MRKPESVSAGELLLYLFDDQPHRLAGPMETWLASSRRFTAFAANFRDKIRKKLRVVRDPETLQDLQLELETAYLLLQEKALNVAYEPEQSKRVRSPDFAVTYTTSLTFMVEVTRLRGSLSSGEGNSPQSERLADAICSKLGQFLPQRSNVLLVGVESLQLTQAEVQSTLLRIQQRAERDDPAFWQRYGFQDRADFFRSYQRLSEILLRDLQLHSNASVLSWVNPRARHPLPSRARTALYRSHSSTA